MGSPGPKIASFAIPVSATCHRAALAADSAAFSSLPVTANVTVPLAIGYATCGGTPTDTSPYVATTLAAVVRPFSKLQPRKEKKSPPE